MDEQRRWSRCPHLGMPDDKALYCTFPSEEHRCFLGDAARRVPVDVQMEFCLGESWADCRRHHREVPEAKDEPIVGQSKIPVYAGGIAVALIAGFVVMIKSTSTASDLPVPTPSVQAVVEAPATPTESAPTRVALSPTAVPVFSTRVPTPAASVGPLGQAPLATPVATPRPASLLPTPPPGSRSYVVAYGDTLSSIATSFGTSVDALVRANGITNRNLINTGQRLIIP